MQDELERLQTRAKPVKTCLVENPPNRPKFVEFAGTPKSGKSTCIDIVSHFFRRIELDPTENPTYSRAKFSVLAPTEGASRRTPRFLKDDWVAFNTWSASYALTHILEGRHHSDRYHLAILDRGLFDALAWFQLLETRREIIESVKETVQQFLLIDHWRSEVDAVFLFTADEKTSLRRETDEQLIDLPGRAMNPDSLKQLNEAYSEIRKQFAGQFKKVISIDTSDSTTDTSDSTTPRLTAIKVADKILDLFTDAEEGAI